MVKGEKKTRSKAEWVDILDKAHERMQVVRDLKIVASEMDVPYSTLHRRYKAYKPREIEVLPEEPVKEESEDLGGQRVDLFLDEDLIEFFRQEGNGNVREGIRSWGRVGMSVTARTAIKQDLSNRAENRHEEQRLVRQLPQKCPACQGALLFSGGDVECKGCDVAGTYDTDNRRMELESKKGTTYDLIAADGSTLPKDIVTVGEYKYTWRITSKEHRDAMMEIFTESVPAESSRTSFKDLIPPAREKRAKEKPLPPSNCKACGSNEIIVFEDDRLWQCDACLAEESY